jgi:hypothetical protein
LIKALTQAGGSVRARHRATLSRDAKSRDIVSWPSAKDPPEKFRSLRHLGEEIFKEEMSQSMKE